MLTTHHNRTRAATKYEPDEFGLLQPVLSLTESRNKQSHCEKSASHNVSENHEEQQREEKQREEQKRERQKREHQKREQQKRERKEDPANCHVLRHPWHNGKKQI